MYTFNFYFPSCIAYSKALSLNHIMRSFITFSPDFAIFLVFVSDRLLKTFSINKRKMSKRTRQTVLFDRSILLLSYIYGIKFYEAEIVNWKGKGSSQKINCTARYTGQLVICTEYNDALFSTHAAINCCLPPPTTNIDDKKSFRSLASALLCKRSSKGMTHREAMHARTYGDVYFYLTHTHTVRSVATRALHFFLCSIDGRLLSH